MTIRYRNTFGDIMAFCFYHYPRSPLVIGTIVVGMGVLSFVFIQAIPSEFTTMAKIITFLVLEALAFLLFAGLIAISVVLSMISSKNKTVLTDHTLTLNEESFFEETVYNRTEQKWNSVQKLARTRRHILIYIAQYLAHVVPRRAFQDDAEWNAFYQFCIERTKDTQAHR
jgi:hypothetical protein